jgi:hypothetical protein
MKRFLACQLTRLYYLGDEDWYGWQEIIPSISVVRKNKKIGWGMVGDRLGTILLFPLGK